MIVPGQLLGGELRRVTLVPADGRHDRADRRFQLHLVLLLRRDLGPVRHVDGLALAGVADLQQPCERRKRHLDERALSVGVEVGLGGDRCTRARWVAGTRVNRSAISGGNGAASSSSTILRNTGY